MFRIYFEILLRHLLFFTKIYRTNFKLSTRLFKGYVWNQ